MYNEYSKRPPVKKKLNFSIGFGFLFSLLSLPLQMVPFFGIAAVLGVLFSLYGMNEAKRKDEKGRGLAIAAIALGAISAIPNILISVRMWLL